MTNLGFIYTYVRHGDEYDLCKLEMRSFFGIDAPSNVLKSSVEVNPSRSPFMKERLEVLFAANSWTGLIEKAEALDIGESTFKVLCLNTIELETTAKMKHDDRQKLEREIGLQINGEPNLLHPETVYGFVKLDDMWFFGKYVESESIWFRHQKKPHSYSTALSTRVARAVANIAVPDPDGLKVIDPCAGIGNVLVEALSMDIDIVGRDINPLVIEPAKENIVHFGLSCEVTASPIADVTEMYDVAIIDMPYNIFSAATPEDQLDILRHARRIAKRVVIVTIETIDQMMDEVGFTIVDRCEAKKGLFVRQVLVCE